MRNIDEFELSSLLENLFSNGDCYLLARHLCATYTGLEMRVLGTQADDGSISACHAFVEDTRGVSGATPGSIQGDPSADEPIYLDIFGPKTKGVLFSDWEWCDDWEDIYDGPAWVDSYLPMFPESLDLIPDAVEHLISLGWNPPPKVSDSPKENS